MQEPSNQSHVSERCKFRTTRDEIRVAARGRGLVLDVRKRPIKVS